jgi:hypothetical protein
VKEASTTSGRVVNFSSFPSGKKLMLFNAKGKQWTQTRSD